MRLLLTVFWRAMHTHRQLLLAFVPVTALLSSLWMAESLWGAHVVDRLVEAARLQTDGHFLRLLGTWLAIYIAINLTQATRKILEWRMHRHILAETRQAYYARILRLDIAHHVQKRAGELMKTADSAADAAVDLSAQALMDAVPSVLTSLAFLAVSFAVSWQLALLIVATFPLYIAITWAYASYIARHMDLVNRLWVRSMGRAYDAVTNIFTVKSDAAEERELRHMERIHREGIAALERIEWTWGAFEGIGYFMVLRILVVAAGIWLMLRGRITLGDVFFFQFSFFRMIVPFELLGHAIPLWGEKLSKLRLAEELYAEHIAVQNRPGARRLPGLRGEIRFDDVSFSYGSPSSRQAIEVIDHLTLGIAAGEHIAFVGHSGAGKSTIAMLLNRFYDVTGGRILVDHIDLRELDIHWWRQQVGLVLQENITFNDAVLENIRYSRPDATEEEVIEAARRASAHAFILRFPQGYQTLVGERGIRLSGGERQRIAIARAILKKPTIVVLDEATSALDSITERSVQEGIRELIQGRTSFIIAHRLSTVRAVDRIALLEEGRLVACAPHAELMKIAPLYREMVELQHGGLLAE